MRRRTLAVARKRVAREIWNQSEGCVLSGPFRGLRYLLSWDESFFSQKILGTYEKELHSLIEAICASNYDLIVDVGAAEGFYACGLAYRIPNARVIAYEAASTMHPPLQKMVEMNQLTDRVEIRQALVMPSELAKDFQSGKNVLLVMDIDGGEWAMLVEATLEVYSDVDILLEVHDRIVPGVSRAIMDKYRSTHELTFIHQRPRTVIDFPASATVRLSDKDRRRSMSECRSRDNDWIWLKSRLSRSHQEQR